MEVWENIWTQSFRWVQIIYSIQWVFNTPFQIISKIVSRDKYKNFLLDLVYEKMFFYRWMEARENSTDNFETGGKRRGNIKDL